MASGGASNEGQFSTDVDVNEAFHNIAQTEQRVADEGFKEGYSSGCKSGEVEGFHLGYHRGAELGAELGYYKGVVEAWIAVSDKKQTHVPEKAQIQLMKLNDMLENFPHNNCDDVDILALAEKIRVSYKKVCSLLKFDGTYPEATKLTF